MKTIHYVAVALETGNIVRSSKGYIVLPEWDLLIEREWLRDWVTPADGPADARFAQATSDVSWDHALSTVEDMQREWRRLKGGA